MAKAKRKLYQKVRREKAAIEAAGKKRGLWAQIGSTLGAVLAMAVTAGAAAPLAAGFLSAGLSYAGGSIGNLLAKGSKGGKIKGGRFFQGSRENLASQITDQITSGAISSGLKAGMMKLGGKLSFGKGGLNVSLGGSKAAAGTGGATAGGFKFGDIFKSGASAEDYGTGLLGRIGKSLDFKNSFAGKGLQNLKEAVGSKILEADYTKRGWIDPNLQGAVAEGGKPIVAMDRIKHAEMQAKIDQVKPITESAFRTLDPTKYGDISGRGGMNMVDVQDMQYQTPGLKADFQRAIPGKAHIQSEGGWQSDMPSGKGLSPGETLAYDKINKMTEEGYAPIHTKEGYYGLPEEFGEGFIDKSTGETVRAPDRPSVPMDMDMGYDEGFELGPEADIKAPGFEGFDEASWASGKKQIQQIDKNLAYQQYLGGGTPAVEGLFEGQDVGTGFTPQEEWYHSQSYQDPVEGSQWWKRKFGR